MIDLLLSLFRRPMPLLRPEEPVQQPTGLYATGTPEHRQRPASLETASQQTQYTAQQFGPWWDSFSNSPEACLRGPRHNLAQQAYAAGAASVYALAESLGVVLHPALEEPEHRDRLS